MTRLFIRTGKFTVFYILLLCWGVTAVADDFDLVSLDLDSYTYPASETIDKRQSPDYATMTLLSRDSSAEVVKFYGRMGLKVRSREDDNTSGDVPQDRIVFESQMLSAHVPLTVSVDTDGSESHSLDDDDLYHDLETYVATGVRERDDLDAVRQRFDSLTHRFYLDRPRNLLMECRSRVKDDTAKQEESMEERGRRMQELAMQGRMDELQKEMESFSRRTGSIDDVVGDKWDEEIECLEKLESESYPVQINVVAHSDDLLGYAASLFCRNARNRGRTEVYENLGSTPVFVSPYLPPRLAWFLPV